MQVRYCVSCILLFYQDDLEENKTVFECVTKLYHDGNLEVMKHMPQLILVGAQVLQHKEVKESKRRPCIARLCVEGYF